MEIQAAIVLVLVFFLMLAMSVPVSFSIISASLLTIIMFLTPGFGMFVSAQKIVSGIDSFTLLAVPFFVLAGLLMSSGGIAKRLINLAMLFLGRVPGSLAMTNIAAMPCLVPYPVQALQRQQLSEASCFLWRRSRDTTRAFQQP